MTTETETKTGRALRNTGCKVGGDSWVWNVSPIGSGLVHISDGQESATCDDAKLAEAIEALGILPTDPPTAQHHEDIWEAIDECMA